MDETQAEGSYGGEFRRRDAVMQAGPKYWPKERASGWGCAGEHHAQPLASDTEPLSSCSTVARVAGATLRTLSYITFLRPFPNCSLLLPIFLPYP